MSITFKVSPEVQRWTKKSTTTEVRAGLAKFLETPIEAAGANVPNVVQGQKMNALLQTVGAAYNLHFSLVLSPDDIWLAIAQGFAYHVDANAETLRKQFVQHEGQKELLHFNDYTRGDPNTDWTQSFKFFSDEIEKHIGKKRDLVVSNFSTTGPIERAASEVVLMGAMKSFFTYREMTLCGFPEITLLGEIDDWKSIRTRVQALSEFDLSWWTTGLVKIIDEFVTTAQGRPNVEFWKGMYRESGGSGGTKITGWINGLFPYLKTWRSDEVNYRNEYAFGEKLRGEGWHGVSTTNYPSGIAVVPFIWDYFGQRFNYEFLGGHVGIHQDEASNIRPAIGWAVREKAREKAPKGEPVQSL